MDTFLELLNTLGNLVPVVLPAAALIAVLVDAAKRFGKVPDGYAGMIALALNAVFFVVVFLAGKLGMASEVEELLVALGVLGPIIVTILTGTTVSALVHKIGAWAGFGFKNP